MQPCPSCGSTQNRATSKFCSNCGATLAQAAPAACPRCGASNLPDAKFCSNCAYALTPSGQFTNLAGMLPPQQLLQARYLIVRQVGSGGMGAVYQVQDKRLTGKTWALKELSDAHITNDLERQNAIAAFQREADILASLDHVNLVKVTDSFQENDKYYLVMEFVQGDTLEQIGARAAGMLDETRVLHWARQLCEVLEYLHNQQPPIIFRDLKPANIMLTAQEQIKLIDFGIARFFQAGKKKDTALFGTAGFAAPEQYGTGQTDARSDVYSFGVVLHHLLTKFDPATAPFQLPPPRALNPNLSPQTEAIVLRATQNSASARFQSMAELQREIPNSKFQIPNPTLQPPISNIQSPVPHPSSFSPRPSLPPPPGMILIPAGDFMMGTIRFTDERPAHRVYVDSFFIDRYPVTNLQYQQFVNATRRQPPKHWNGGQIPPGKERHPVVNVTWDDAEAYSVWAGKRLPTEAEWEKAARGTDSRDYPWGNTFDDALCNARGKRGGTVPVGSFPPNSNSPYGMCDLVGNVWEWCADWYMDTYYLQSPPRNPQGPPDGIYRATRGGGWNSAKEIVRCAARHGSPPSVGSLTIGFRCAK